MLCVLRMRVLPRFPGLNPLTLPVISYVTLGRSCKFSVPQILPLLEEGPVFSRSFPALSQGQQDKRERRTTQEKITQLTLRAWVDQGVGGAKNQGPGPHLIHGRPLLGPKVAASLPAASVFTHQLGVFPGWMSCHSASSTKQCSIHQVLREGS